MDQTPMPKEDLAKSEVPEVMTFLKTKGKYLLTAVVAVVAVALISDAVKTKRANTAAAAEGMLLQARTPEQLQEVIKTYPKSAAAPVALLDMAKGSFNKGEFFTAREQYNQFLSDYSSHDLQPVAALGIASCSEAEGDYTAAIAEFKAFIAADKADYLQPLAVMGLARSLKQEGQLEEARIVVEDFLADNSNSTWRGQAETLLLKLK